MKISTLGGGEGGREGESEGGRREGEREGGECDCVGSALGTHLWPSDFNL